MAGTACLFPAAWGCQRVRFEFRVCAPSCAGDTGDGLLCPRCTGRLRQALTAIAQLWPDLEVVLSRQARTGSGGKRVDDSPLPVDVQALKVYSYVRNQLQTWVRLLDMGDLGGLSEPRLWALWLSARTERCRTHVASDEILAEFEYCRGLVWRVVDLAPEMLYCGSCPVCGGYLYAKPGAKEVVCRRCAQAGIGTPAVNVAARRGEMGAAAEDLLVTLDELLVAVPSLYGVEVRRNTVSVWVHRGRLVTHGRDPVRYRVGDVLDLVHGMTLRSA